MSALSASAHLAIPVTPNLLIYFFKHLCVCMYIGVCLSVDTVEVRTPLDLDPCSHLKSVCFTVHHWVLSARLADLGALRNSPCGSA